jgi:hypothetical protein
MSVKQKATLEGIEVARLLLILLHSIAKLWRCCAHHLHCVLEKKNSFTGRFALCPTVDF